MSRNLVAVVAGLVVTASTAFAAATRATSRPAAPEAPPAGVRAQRTVLLMTSEQMAIDVAEAKFCARWGCVLAGLALVGVLWVGWSMRTLARNQIEMARMIQALRAAPAD